MSDAATPTTCATCPRPSGSFRWCMVCTAVAGRERLEEWNHHGQEAVLGLVVRRWRSAGQWLAAGSQYDEERRRRQLYAPDDAVSALPAFGREGAVV